MDKIAVIGAGKIAHSLTSALVQSGFKINFILSKSASSAKALAKKFSIPDYSNNYSDVTSANIFFICTPDSSIEEAAFNLSQCEINFSKSLFIHLSGSLDISCLRVLKDKGAGTASLHIMQSFPSKKVVSIKNCYCAVETEDDSAGKFLFRLAKKLELKPFKIESGQKVFYHIAGVFMSNFLVGNFYNALLAFNESGVKDVDFIKLFEPIIKATIANIKKNGITKALSGPVDRGDIKTITRHIEALDNAKVDSEKQFNVLLNYIIQSAGLIEVTKEKYGKVIEGEKVIKEELTNKLRQVCFKKAKELTQSKKL